MLTQNKFTSIVPRWYPIRRIKYPACYRLKGKKNGKKIKKACQKASLLTMLHLAHHLHKNIPAGSKKKVM